MQISAANLLLAAQQVRPSASPHAQGTAFAGSMAGVKQAAKPFALPDLDATSEAGEEAAGAPRTPGEAVTATSSAPAPIGQSGGYAATMSPGSSLDISV